MIQPTERRNSFGSPYKSTAGQTRVHATRLVRSNAQQLHPSYVYLLLLHQAYKSNALAVVVPTICAMVMPDKLLSSC